MKHFDEALIEAKKWSTDERNNIGEAVVCKNPNGYYGVSAIGPEEWIVAKFIDGKRIK